MTTTMNYRHSKFVRVTSRTALIFFTITEHAGAQAAIMSIVWGSWLLIFRPFAISPLTRMALEQYGTELFWGGLTILFGLFRFLIFLADYTHYKFHFSIFDYLSLAASVMIATIWFVIFLLFVLSVPRAMTTPIFFIICMVAVTDVFQSSGFVNMLRGFFVSHFDDD